MSDDPTNGTAYERAVELLRELGQKQYEAKCFAALTRLSTATAKEVSEAADVPRTRVYDAMRSLEAQGLVEVQHSNPQRFRAVSIDEAAELLRKRYVSRVEELEATLESVEPVAADDSAESVGEIWSLTGSDAVTTRTRQLIENADEEVALVIGDETVIFEGLFDSLDEARARGVKVTVGTHSDAVGERIRAASDVPVFTSGLEWLRAAGEDEDVSIGRLLLVDGSALLVSSIEAGSDEHAVFGSGVGNGFVVIVRRLLATGFDSTAAD